jgi:hypothetical protein
VSPVILDLPLPPAAGGSGRTFAAPKWLGQAWGRSTGTSRSRARFELAITMRCNSLLSLSGLFCMRFAFTLSKSCLMRCMMCGDKMVLTEAMPAEAGGVQGFEIQTHHCPACRGTERRFIFVGRKTDFVEGGVKTSTLACAAHEVKVSHHVNGQIKRRCTRVRASSSLLFRLKGNLAQATTG